MAAKTPVVAELPSSKEDKPSKEHISPATSNSLEDAPKSKPKSKKKLVKVRDMNDSIAREEDKFASARSSFGSARSSFGSHVRRSSQGEPNEEEESFSSPLGEEVQSNENKAQGDIAVEKCLVEASKRLASQEQFQSSTGDLDGELLNEGAAGLDSITSISPVVQQDNVDLILDDGAFQLTGEAAHNLYEHQREGLKWLWSLHKRKTGGILGDDMVRLGCS